jgi:hypothetical protein
MGIPHFLRQIATWIHHDTCTARILMPLLDWCLLSEFFMLFASPTHRSPWKACWHISG